MSDYGHAGEEPENDYWLIENFVAPLTSIMGVLTRLPLASRLSVARRYNVQQ